MAGESSDDEGPEEVSLQSGRDAAAQQRSQEKEVTQKSRCVPPSRLAQVACTLTHSTTAHSRARRDKKEATAKERKIVNSVSDLDGKYDEAVDRESAEEVLAAKAAPLGAG